MIATTDQVEPAATPLAMIIATVSGGPQAHLEVVETATIVEVVNVDMAEAAVMITEGEMVLLGTAAQVVTEEDNHNKGIDD